MAAPTVKVDNKKNCSTCGLAPTVKLNNGKNCPAFGLGTWLIPPYKCAKIVKYAIKIGYRHFDTAWLYGNEKELGIAIREAIEEGMVKREDLFISTKLWNTFHEKDDVLPALKKSLINFGLEYVDLYMMHWPVACKNVGIVDITYPYKDSVLYDHDFCLTWEGMEDCVTQGLTLSIGLCNFNSKQVDKLLARAKIKPVMNQVEVNLFNTQKQLIEFCLEKDIHVAAHSPFGSPERPYREPNDPVIDFNDPTLLGIAQTYDKTTAQIMLRYLYELGTIPLPKSENQNRIQENISIFNFELKSEDKEILDGFNRNIRFIRAKELSESKDYPFRGVEF